jgi:hypothetical protein
MEVSLIVRQVMDIFYKNKLLFLFYPVVFFLNILSIKYFSSRGEMKYFFFIALISQMEMGYIKQVYLHKVRLYLLDFCFLIFFVFLFAFLLAYVFLQYFRISFSYKYFIVVFVGIVLNEIKAIFESKERYDLGFIYKSIFLLCMPFCVLLNLDIFSFIIISSMLLSAIFIYYKNKGHITFQSTVYLKENFSFLRFFFLNIFALVGGNLDRLLLHSFLNVQMFNNYVIFAETNQRVNSMFMFFNNLFLYKHLKLTQVLIWLTVLAFSLVVTILWYFLDLDLFYFAFSISTLSSIVSQFYIFSKLGDTNKLNSVFFSLVGILVFWLLYFLLEQTFGISMIGMVFILIIKSFVECIYVYSLTISSKAH